MRLLYTAPNGEWINGVPARDLEAHEVQAVANEWGKSLAETEGLLIKSGKYKAEVPPVIEETDNAPRAPKKRGK